jgi:imidazolonepropionase-like amidohydrolase
MGAEGSVTIKLTAADTAEGTLDIAVQGQKVTGAVRMTRTSTTASAPAEKKGPRKDESLEAFRPLFRREIPALAVAVGLPAVENAVKVLRDECNVDVFVLAGAEADFSAQAVARAGVGVVLGAEVLRERHGSVSNAAEALASMGVPIAFGSGAASGTPHLVLQAVHAVRYGLDTHDALKAVTVNPARLARQEARLGAIERGRDADIVLYTGDPFLLTSRVRMVLIDGRIVHEVKP